MLVILHVIWVRTTLKMRLWLSESFSSRKKILCLIKNVPVINPDRCTMKTSLNNWLHSVRTVTQSPAGSSGGQRRQTAPSIKKLINFTALWSEVICLKTLKTIKLSFTKKREKNELKTETSQRICSGLGGGWKTTTVPQSHASSICCWRRTRTQQKEPRTQQVCPRWGRQSAAVNTRITTMTRN